MATVDGYNEMVDKVELLFSNFIHAAKDGADNEKRGFMKNSRNARKISVEIGKLLGEFRKLSVKNDNARPAKTE